MGTILDVLTSIMTCAEGWNLSPCQYLIIYSDRCTITNVYGYLKNMIYLEVLIVHKNKSLKRISIFSFIKMYSFQRYIVHEQKGILLSN